MASEKAAPRAAIVVPCYRAEKTIAGVLERIPTAFWEQGVAILINDASPDHTGEVVEKLKGQYPAVDVIHHDVNSGYGGAQKHGLQRGLELGAQGFAVVHADGQYPPEMVMDLLAPIFEGRAQIVQGSRFLKGGALEGNMPMVRYIANRTLTTMENLLFGTKMAEFHSGYMLYSRKLLEETPFEKLQNNFNFDAEMIILANLLGYECEQIAIPTRYDDETSSLPPLPYGINVLKMMARFARGHYRGLLKDFQQRKQTPA